MRLDLPLCGMWYCEALVLLDGVFLQCRVLALSRVYCIICTMYAAACSIHVLVCTTQHFQRGGQRTSLRTTTPHLPRTNPPTPPFHKLELLSSLYFMYFVLLPVSVMFHTVLSDPVLICFVKLCVCRDLYTMRARMHIASP